MVVLTVGAFSTTLTSSTPALSTSMTMFTSAAALMPTLISFWTTVLSLGAVARTSNVPGKSWRRRNIPSSLV